MCQAFETVPKHLMSEAPDTARLYPLWYGMRQECLGGNHLIRPILTAGNNACQFVESWRNMKNATPIRQRLAQR